MAVKLDATLTFFLSLLAVCVFFCHLELSSSQALKSFGESCDNDCDERQLLTCSQNTSICECMQSRSMIFDPEQQKCVGKANFPCVRYATDFHCVPHASCNRTTKFCNCDKGYSETDNGTSCSPLAKYGESCSGRRPCDRSSGMSCMEKAGPGSGRNKRVCQCQYPADQYYDPEQATCVSYAGGNCSFSWPCVHNAGCTEDIYELRQGENLHGKQYFYNVTIGRKCACREGTRITRDRQCSPGYLSACDFSFSGGCNAEENLKCFDSRVCLCRNPLSMTYETAVGKCTFLVGVKCTKGEGEGGNGSADSVCTANAECSSESGRCVCKTGFSSTPSSACLKDFGTECGGGGVGGTDCNVYRGLNCQANRTCGCFCNLRYDHNSKTCYSLEGERCGIFKYSYNAGFILGGRDDGDEGATMMTATGNRKELIRNGNRVVIGTTSFSISPEGGKENHSASAMKSAVKIHIKCEIGLECVNEFGELIGKCDKTEQGFCRQKL